ncbi:macrophage metalloelastase-like isoform X2 [Hemiscyllium ocellatum]|uniref:macrophage metalloelastase-like isoform X2 n=1 Tax=Hemiscyllium ocellatum TaxID=170820 RepID=UPI0029669027|nr:macrophage metalloelastase-like isoform X2 [Hemiscyllium ocellatum]
MHFHWLKTSQLQKLPRVRQYTRDLSEATVDEVLRRGFKHWSDVTPLSFRKTDAIADIEIIFSSGEHGDGVPFDGSGGVLAHAFAPGPGLGGDAHFDDAEIWTTGNDGINLEIVVTHEVGHSLGLGHSNKRDAVMFATYFFRDPFMLSPDDVRGIQFLYGRPVAPPGTNPTQGPLPCDPDVFMDAAVRFNRNFLFFKNGFYRTARSSSIIPVNSTWPSITSNIDAAVEYSRRRQRRNNILFFTGDQYWHFTGTVLNSGFPKPISTLGFPSSVSKIDAAMRVGGRSIVFFVGNQFWRYDTLMNQMRGRPRLINKVFAEISTVNAAFSHNRRFYLTSGPSVFIFSGRRLVRRFEPQPWLNCE